MAIAASGLLQARTGRAQPAGEPPRLAVALEVTTLEACPAERFQRALESRVRRSFEARPGAAATLRVTIAALREGGMEGSASFSGRSGSAARSVRGTCDEITSALALVATTWLEAEPYPEASPATPVATPPTTTLPAASGAGARDTTARESPRTTEEGPRKRFSLGAHGVATLGLVGGPAGGAALAFAYETDRFELRASLRGALGGETSTAGSARYGWLTAGADGCVHALTGRGLRLAGCARIEPGYFHASFAGVGRDLPWLGVGAGARLGWSIAPVRLEIEAFGSVPVTGYRLTPSEATLVPFRTFVPALAAGIMVPFS